MSVPNVTAVVLTLNEQEHLPDCLTSLAGLAQRTIVLDSRSTDRTREIALNHGAEVIHSPFRGYASQRNEGLRLAGDADWVLFLDADERLTDTVRSEVTSLLSNAPPDHAGFWVPRKNVAFGRELRGGGWWPDFQARIIRSGLGRYDDAREVHEIVLFDGPTAYLTHPIVHLNYSSRREFVRKQREYTLRYVESTGEIIPRRRSYLGRPVREFWRRFVVLSGYRDRADGLFMAAVMALEEFRACLILRRRARS